MLAGEWANTWSPTCLPWYWYEARKEGVEFENEEKDVRRLAVWPLRCRWGICIQSVSCRVSISKTSKAVISHFCIQVLFLLYFTCLLSRGCIFLLQHLTRKEWLMSTWLWLYMWLYYVMKSSKIKIFCTSPMLMDRATCVTVFIKKNYNNNNLHFCLMPAASSLLGSS